MGRTRQERKIRRERIPEEETGEAAPVAMHGSFLRFRSTLTSPPIYL
jgi:hypothetical protein